MKEEKFSESFIIDAAIRTLILTVALFLVFPTNVFPLARGRGWMFLIGLLLILVWTLTWFFDKHYNEKGRRRRRIPVTKKSLVLDLGFLVIVLAGMLLAFLAKDGGPGAILGTLVYSLGTSLYISFKINQFH